MFFARKLREYERTVEIFCRAVIISMNIHNEKGFDMEGQNEDREFPQENLNAGSQPKTIVKKSNRKRNALIALGAVAIAFVFFFTGWFARYLALDRRARDLLWLMETADDHYYREISDEEWNDLYDRFYDMVLPDRFCSFYTGEEYRKLLGESEGNNKDTGLSAIDEGGRLRVYNVIGNSPAALAGIRSGMYIYRFGTSVEEMKEGNRNEFYALSGNAIYLECGDTQESAKVCRIQSENYLASYCSYRDSQTSFDFRTKGDKLELTDTGNAHEGLDGTTAYISVSQFDGNVSSEFKAMLSLMKSRGRSNLILDLRRNGGGYLRAFQEMSAHLLRNAEDGNPLVATAKYRSGKVTRFRATGNDFGNYFDDTSRVSVLADERTASASECLIGALIDYGTADFSDVYLRKTDGEEARSYGKGVMQTAYVAPSGSAARITTAEIFWPVSGRSIHDTGVTERLGAVGIVAPLLSGERDSMLDEVISRLCGAGGDA